MHTVLGLSLKSNEVAWVILDATHGTVLDHDALELRADAEVADAAARSAHAIARACGFEVDRVRLTWTDDVAHDGLRLRTGLGRPGFGEVETVPVACASAVLVDPEATGITPRLALAYGAALAVVGPSEPITVPAVQQHSRFPHRRILSAALGVAAAAILGLLCLSAGVSPKLEPPTATAEESGPSDAGWATVLAPSDVAATLVRKVVVAPSYAEQQTAVPVQADVPVRVVAATAPEPPPARAEQPHLSGALPGAAPVSGLADPASASAPAPEPEPDMTAVVDALSALP